MPSPLSQITPDAKPLGSVTSSAGAPPICSFSSHSPDGTGTGRIDVGLPSSRISWARSAGRPGRDSTNVSSWLAVAPVDDATGLRAATIASVVTLPWPDVPPYCTAIAGPTVISSVLPPRQDRRSG